MNFVKGKIVVDAEISGDCRIYRPASVRMKSLARIGQDGSTTNG